MMNDFEASDDLCRSIIRKDRNIRSLFANLNQGDNDISNPKSGQLIDLNRAYNSKKLTLVIGAGVSKGCGLPDWNGLLKKLRDKIQFCRGDLDNQSIIINKIFFKLFKLDFRASRLFPWA